jgi:hypothetical protein
MKTYVCHLKKVLRNNKDDLKYLLYVGIPTLIIMIILSRCIDYSHLF